MPVEPEHVLLSVVDNPNLYIFWCGGCGYCHHLDTTRWKWNGDAVRPTVTPSLLVNAAQAGEDPRCHIFVTDGKIQYLADCTHALAGQTVTMIPPP